MCQSSGQNTVSYNIRNSYWHFQINFFFQLLWDVVFVVIIAAKCFCRNIVVTSSVARGGLQPPPLACRPKCRIRKIPRF